MKKVLLVIMAFAMIVTLSTAANAANYIMFNDTDLGWIPVSSFDWLVGNALSDGSAPVRSSFNLYFQASLVALVAPDGIPYDGRDVAHPLAGLGSDYEITVVAAVSENATYSGFNANFVVNPTAGNNFIYVYYDSSPDASALNGTGYNGAGGAVLLMSGSGGTTSGFKSGFGNFTAAGPDQTPGTPDDIAYVDATGVPVAMDNFGASNNYPNIYSLTGGGSTVLNAAIDPSTVNGSYISPSGAMLLSFLVSTNSSQIVPFNQQDPSAQFWNATSATTGSFINPNFFPLADGIHFVNGYPTSVSPGPDGLIGTSDDIYFPSWNGTTLYDFQFQADANSSFRVSVPEPTSIILLGIGFLGIAGLGMRRKQN